MDYRFLRELFLSCLEANYLHVEEGASYAVVRDGDLLYIFFEKSNGQEDWVNNLSYHAVPFGRGESWFCHEGFLKVWHAVLPYLENLLKSPSVRRVITVGYSHGAAVALLCHEYLVYARPDLEESIETYGFGCPRVIWGTVPEEGRRWRNFFVIRNIDDAVTHLPPKFLGYRHVGRLITVGKKGLYSGIDAHRAENYLRELEKAEMTAEKLEQ